MKALLSRRTRFFRLFAQLLLGLFIALPSGALAHSAPAAERLVFYWGIGCPHCEEAKPFLQQLATEHPELSIEWVEIRQSPAGRQRFGEMSKTLHVQGAGLPTFVVGERYVVGFRPGVTEMQVKALLGLTTADENTTKLVDLPLIGVVDPAQLPLPVFTLMIGLVDGINPCALWVLLVLLGLLSHAKDQRRLVMYGSVFVLMSGVVYFLFMSAWLGLFRFIGLSRIATIILGLVVLVMGLINIKELFWFKQGVSLMIPESAKPKLYKRMRAIEAAASVPAAFLGIIALAFVVNLIELGCTLGLPAIYTRVLSLRAEMSEPLRYAYLALYNLAYIVPLGLVVLIYTVTHKRLALHERGAKILKLVSGVLLVLFGLLLLLRPELLQA